MAMTPRQLFAAVSLAGRRLKRDAARALSIAALGARGKEDKVKKAIEDWETP